MSSQAKPLIVVISGPGGAGKSTVVSALLEEVPKLWLSRSWTTRQRRENEDADAYVFVTREEFDARVASDGFFEHAEFLGNYYGTPVPEPPEGFDVLLEIEVQGARQVRSADPDALLIFLEAPTPEDQEARLRGRGDPEEKVQQRIKKAAEESIAAAELDACRVVNDTVDQTVTDLAVLIAAARSAQRSKSAPDEGAADEQPTASQASQAQQ